MTTLWLPKGTSAAFERRATPEDERPLPADPVEFAQQAGVHLWSKQREIARSVVENRRTYVPSAHMMGKTFLAAEIGAHWLAGAPPGSRKLVTSAPGGDQLFLVWGELAMAHYRHGLPGSVSGTEWHVGPAGSRLRVGFGSKPKDYVNPEQAMTRFQGVHASEGVLVILDEATGIPPWLWVAAESITAGESDRLLAIGNPDDPSTEFAKRCAAGTGSTHGPGKRYTVRAKSGRAMAEVIPIDAYASPNFTGEPVPLHVRKSLLPRSTAEDWAEQWGEDNPLYVAKVRGQFPDRSSQNVISPAMIRRAWATDHAGLELGCFGLDVARSLHGDESALYRDRGGQVRSIWVGREPDSTSLAAIVLRATKHVPQAPIAVDTDGIGGPVHDMIRRGLPDLGLTRRTTIAFSVAGSPQNPRDYDTRRSEVWFTARFALDKGLWDLDEADDELAGQLMAPRHYLKQGVFHVETKEELAKRGVNSPDRADACIMAFMGNAMARRRKLLTDTPKANGNGHAPRSMTGDLMKRAF
jgi:hypothetical protein